ncbi:8-oxoguanine DNA glycosylase OGG fold protein [Streptomyces omiyaensis]|uniref:Uncharacterized protein n=1 Tax=Streptomyces omiyaensis TaxID=68247 RepID=A0ABW7BU48_9ACTN
MRGRQDLADALDAELMKRLLPTTAVSALREWLAGAGAPCTAGAGAHAVTYTPARWSGIEPWPVRLRERTHTGNASISRAQVAAVVRKAVQEGDLPQALVASYVWGQGRTGFGPHRLKEILAEPNLPEALSEADTALRGEGAAAAYRVLYREVRGLGPAFFTKLLYFLDLGMDTSSTPRALILDQRVAQTVRIHATRIGVETGVTSAPAVSAWVWSNGGWTPHRYEIYLHWIDAAAEQLAASGIGWPGSSPDLLELALFDRAWDPAV